MRELIIKSKQKVFSLYSGRHLSRLKGSGLDFKEIREYSYNEDAKKIDWKISAKVQKPMVKEFDETKELNIILLYLLSGNMHFGSVKLKSELAIEIISLLSFSAIKNDDKVTLIAYDKKPIHFKPTKSTNTIFAYLEKLSQINLLGKDFDFYFIEYLNRFKKSILFIISDFYKIPPIHKLKHETYSIIIRDKFEENPNFNGLINIIDPITQKENEVFFTKYNLIKYKKHIKKHDKELKEYLNSKKIKHTKIYTNEDPFFKLGELLK